MKIIAFCDATGLHGLTLSKSSDICLFVFFFCLHFLLIIVSYVCAARWWCSVLSDNKVYAASENNS